MLGTAWLHKDDNRFNEETQKRKNDKQNKQVYHISKERTVEFAKGTEDLVTSGYSSV